MYDQRDYRWKVYPFAEAVQCHRETHHPDMYNQPNATLQVCVELNMQGEKQVCNIALVYFWWQPLR